MWKVKHPVKKVDIETVQFRKNEIPETAYNTQVLAKNMLEKPLTALEKNLAKLNKRITTLNQDIQDGNVIMQRIAAPKPRQIDELQSQSSSAESDSDVSDGHENLTLS